MQGFRERETVAKIQETVDLEALSAVVFEMERGVADLVAWGTLVEAIGTCPNPIDPTALYVVGCSISQAAETVQFNWKRCHGLVQAAGGAR